MLQTLTIKLALIGTLGIFPLMSGKGFLFFGNHDAGHYQVTEDVAREFGFSRPAQLLLAEAVIDPDFYEWSQPRAHAQTANDAKGKPAETEAQAMKNLYAWLDDKLNKISQQLQAGHDREALYWLGYSLHAVQDLSPHQGITNAQHAYLSSIDKNPDQQPEALTRARQFSKQYLGAVRDKLGPQNWSRLLHQQGPTLSPSEKDKLIGHGWELTLGELLTYQNDGDLYKNLSPRVEIHWDTPKVLAGYLATLK